VNYALRILPRAEKDLAALDPKSYGPIKNKIYSLAQDPRPPGCRKLRGYPAWRIRLGNYRVVYEIDDTARTITILRVGHRKEIYR
jgi:mRNA interferase RelE/StbE